MDLLPKPPQQFATRLKVWDGCRRLATYLQRTLRPKLSRCASVRNLRAFIVVGQTPKFGVIGAQPSKRKVLQINRNGFALIKMRRDQKPSGGEQLVWHALSLEAIEFANDGSKKAQRHAE